MLPGLTNTYIAKYDLLHKKALRQYVMKVEYYTVLLERLMAQIIIQVLTLYDRLSMSHTIHLPALIAP